MSNPCWCDGLQANGSQCRCRLTREELHQQAELTTLPEKERCAYCGHDRFAHTSNAVQVAHALSHGQSKHPTLCCPDIGGDRKSIFIRCLSFTIDFAFNAVRQGVVLSLKMLMFLLFCASICWFAVKLGDELLL